MFSFRKTISALLFLTLFSFVAIAQELSVDYNSTKLSAVLADIQTKTGYHFVTVVETSTSELL